MSRELQVITGKGGTGKTTVACALAYAYALRGDRALVCEVEGRSAVGDLFGVTLVPGRETTLARTAAGGQVVGLSVDARSSLEEYLDKYFRLGVAGKALERFGAIEFATSIAPGLSDVLLTGKVYEAVRRRIKGRPDAYDVVVLDAPPTGRIARFMDVHRSVADLARVGPIHAQARSIRELFTSPTTVIHLTTLLEDMPVTETLDAVRELRATGIPLGAVVCTMTTPPLTGDDGLLEAQLGAAAAGDLPVADLGDPRLEQGLTATLHAEAARYAEERDHRAELAACGLPQVDVPLLPDGIDAEALREIAGWLAEDLLTDEEGAR